MRLNLYFWKIRRIKNQWEVKRTGKNWHNYLVQRRDMFPIKDFEGF